MDPNLAGSACPHRSCGSTAMQNAAWPFCTTRQLVARMCLATAGPRDVAAASGLGTAFRVQGLGFRFQGLGFRVYTTEAVRPEGGPPVRFPSSQQSRTRTALALEANRGVHRSGLGLG